MDTRSTALLGAAPRGLSPRTVEVEHDRAETARFTLLLRFFAQPLVDVRELPGVFDAVVGLGEGFFFLPSLEI